MRELNSATVAPERKWRAFCSIWLFPYSLISQLENLPANFQGLTVLLYFMRMHIKVEMWETEVVVRQACQLETISPDVPQCPEFGLPEPRGIHMAALLVRGIHELITSVLVCNFPVDIETVMPWKFFDGKLFQSIYKQRLIANRSEGESLPNLDETGEAMMEIISN